jgi:hypothetical protein
VNRLYESFSRTTRFLTSLVPPALLFVGFFGVVGLVRIRVQGWVGTAVGIVAGASLALGLLLAYWVFFDWLNLRVIRKTLRGGSALRDGEVVAFDGFVRIEGEPMISPFSGTPCAAYTYFVASSRESSPRSGRERSVLAQGFHMVRTRIEGATHSLELCSFPAFEDDLREDASGARWGGAARALIDGLSGKAPSAGERERQSRLLEVRHTEVDEVHQDYLMGAVGPSADALVIVEEVLPLGQAVCAIGTYDRERNGLTARRSRLGPNLFVYRGSAAEISSRMDEELRRSATTVAWLLGIGALLLGLALLPVDILSRIPLIGSSVVAPS